MPHLDPDLLALLALGERGPSAAEAEHLRDCPPCAAEYARFARAVMAARLSDSAEVLERPSPRVWAGIAEELGLSAAARADPLPPAAPILPIRRRRGRLTVALAAAAAVLLAIGGVTTWIASTATRTVATADLRAFPGWQGERGSAVLERAADGREVVQLRTSVRPDSTTDHEVWLMTDGARQLVSLGYLHGSSGTFVVPAGLDLSRYHLIDLSDEPRDGDPAHSGDSIVRGTFRA